MLFEGPGTDSVVVSRPRFHHSILYHRHPYKRTNGPHRKASDDITITVVILNKAPVLHRLFFSHRSCASCDVKSMQTYLCGTLRIHSGCSDVEKGDYV